MSKELLQEAVEEVLLNKVAFEVPHPFKRVGKAVKALFRKTPPKPRETGFKALKTWMKENPEEARKVKIGLIASALLGINAGVMLGHHYGYKQGRTDERMGYGKI